MRSIWGEQWEQKVTEIAAAMTGHTTLAFRKVRLLAISDEIANGHLALMVDGGEHILLERDDLHALRDFMSGYEGAEFYHDEPVEVGDQREGRITVTET